MSPPDPFARLAPADRALLRTSPEPQAVEPMKAVLTDERFSDPAWIYERKLDGIRCVAICRGSEVRLLSRNDLSLNGRFPEVAEALVERPHDVVLDGEVVAFDGAQTSFARLARRGHEPAPAFYYVFDVIWRAGRDTTMLPLRTRKSLLRDAAGWGGALRRTTHRNRDGEAYYAEACRKGWEGLIAKRADSPYVHGRSKHWLKFKCVAEQELVIGGFTAPQGSREELGALLVGHFADGGGLAYAGKVGTGFDRATLEDLGRRLRPLARKTSPFADPDLPGRGTTWVEPELVAEIAFSEWTRDGRLRHPRFLGLREDKDARDVVRERARPA